MRLRAFHVHWDAPGGLTSFGGGALARCSCSSASPVGGQCPRRLRRGPLGLLLAEYGDDLPHTLSLFAFSLLKPVAGSPLAAGNGVALVAWSVSVWALKLFQ